MAVCAHYANASNQTQLLALTLCSGVQIILVGWVSLSQQFDSLKSKQAITTAIAISLIGLFSAPLLEDDHFRYLWDGYMTATTGNPYLHPPSFFFGAVNLPAGFDAVLNGVNYPTVKTIYGPLLQLIFAGSYWVAPAQLWPINVILGVALISIVILLARQGVHPKWLLVLCIHPLLLKESVISGHPDLLIGAFVVGAIGLWQRQCYRYAVVLVCCAAAIKINIAVLLPLFCLNQRGRINASACVVAVGTLGLFHLPLVLPQGLDSLSGLATFARHWVFNPLLYRGLSLLLSDQTARTVSLALLLVTIAIVLALQRNKLSIYGATLTVLIAMILLAPAANPWYWLWLLPLATLFGYSAVVAASITSLLAYIHFLSLNSFAVPVWAGVFQTAVILAALYRTVISPSLNQSNDFKSLARNSTGSDFAPRNPAN